MMQTDVKSARAANTGLLVTQIPVRLKSITVTSATVSARTTCVCDPSIQESGTYSRTSPSATITVTIVNHGLETGDRVFLDFTSGAGRDGAYTITKTGNDTFTCVDAPTTTTSGNVTAYSSIALEIDTFNTIGLPVLIPGEGIYCPNGIFVGCGSSVTATVYYG
jgi:hypothetical protein